MPYKEQLEESAKHILGIYKEAQNQSRMLVVEAHHQIGQTIMSLPTKYSAVQDLARLTQMSERSLYLSAQFYNKYPNFDKVPEGKAISWTRIVTKYLPEKQKEEVKQCDHKWLCTKCGERR